MLKKHRRQDLVPKVSRGNSKYRVIPKLNTSRIRISRLQSWERINVGLLLYIGLNMSFIKPESGGGTAGANRLTVRNAKVILVGKR